MAGNKSDFWNVPAKQRQAKTSERLTWLFGMEFSCVRATVSMQSTARYKISPEVRARFGRNSCCSLETSTNFSWFRIWVTWNVFHECAKTSPHYQPFQTWRHTNNRQLIALLNDATADIQPLSFPSSPQKREKGSASRDEGELVLLQFSNCDQLRCL